MRECKSICAQFTPSRVIGKIKWLYNYCFTGRENWLSYYINWSHREGRLSAVKRFLKDIFYATRLTHFFMYFVVTLLMYVLVTKDFPMVMMYYPFFEFSWVSIRAVLACVSNGLLFTYVMIFNDWCDVDVDKFSGRKHTPLIRGIINDRTQLRWAVEIAIASFILALFCGWRFIILTIISLIGGYMYSAKPFAAKRRAGWDLFCNGLDPFLIGVSGCIVGGYTFSTVPWAFCFIWFLIGAAFFIAGDILDIKYDSDAGLKTFATALGFKGAIYALISDVLLIFIMVAVMGFSNYYFSPAFILYWTPFFFIGLIITLGGAFKYAFDWKKQTCEITHESYKKLYPYLGVGIGMMLYPLIHWFLYWTGVLPALW